ncbi:MAG: DUF1080 domain-containing protein [Verrucomicrobia bacterium]|nr:DUF1080 domain-containing protein [Verrucomicrobiota bacterium]
MKSRLLAPALMIAVCAPFAAAADNQLTAAEKTAGWSLVFDGKSFDGLRVYRQKGPPTVGWEIKDGMLKTVAKVKGTDLVTQKKYTDFEFSWDWRVEPGGNNGVKYCVTEDRPGAPGYEYQMIDDDKHPDAKNGAIRQTAAFYYVLPAHDRPLKPGGEWNTSRIVVKGNHVQHWLNGRNVLEFDLGSEAVKKGVAASKFAKQPGFGDKITGHVMLTYHQDECWYKNVKIRELK